jgi:hypothetical protein
MTAEIAKSEELVEVNVNSSLAELKTEDELSVTKMPPAEPLTGEQLQRYGERTSAFIDSLQGYIADFLNTYKPALSTLGWILLAAISVKLILAALDAINDIPFLTLLLQLIGLGYVIWFVYRYLLSAASRQELSQEFESFKQQFLGTEN